MSRLLSSKPHICSCELCPGLWGPPAPSPSGTYKCHLPTDTPSALGQQPNLSFPEGIPLCLRLLTGGREGEGSWGTGPEESLWTAWQFGGGVEGRGGADLDSRGPPRQCNYSSNVKNAQKSQTSCFAQRPRQRGSVSAHEAPPTPKTQGETEPELLPARPSQSSSPRPASQEVKEVGFLGQAWPATEGRLGCINVRTGQEQPVSPEDTVGR